MMLSAENVYKPKLNFLLCSYRFRLDLNLDFRKDIIKTFFLKQKDQDINSLCRFFKNLELLYVDKFQT